MGLAFICLTAAIGGLLFGFDTAVISGTISYVKSQFALDVAAEGWFVSSGLAGCIVGVIATSYLSDQFGRKAVLIISAIMFLLSGLGCAFAPGFDLLVAARILGGVGVGMASVVSPMYIAEFAPASSRGRMIAFYQLAITLGILLAYFSNAGLLALSHSEQLPAFFTKEVWRPMFLVMSLPAAIFIAMLLGVPESPRWLFSRNRQAEAESILTKLKGEEESQKEIETMKQSSGGQELAKVSLLDKSLRLPLIIGITLAILQQFCGINAIIYYGPRIFQSAGVAGGDALLFQVIIGVINFLFTFVAIANADKYGRKFLLLTGLTGIIVSLVACGALFLIGKNSMLLLAMILLFIACFALSLGPITWIIINEIFPTAARARAVSLCTFSLWVAVWLVGQFFPWLLETAGPAVTFWTFAFFSTVNMIFSWKVVKETKNKTLEEVEQMFISPH